MAINVRDIAKSAEKWERRSLGSSDDYLEGSRNPRRMWEEESLKSENNYKSQVIKAANEGRFGKGIKKSGQEKYLRQIEKKGKPNFETGIMGSSGDWEAGAAPFITAVSKVQLPSRGAKNSAENYNRARMVGETQSKLKEEMRARRAS